VKVSVVAGRDLDFSLRDRWRQLQRSNPDLGSPYFCVEFTEALALAHAGVEVAVIEEGGEPVAFFPYHRCPRATAKPIGGLLSDYQGFICAPHFFCDPLEILKACSLVAWDFDHLITSQTFFAPFYLSQDVSPILDLANGFDAYSASIHAARAESIKLRRLERDWGPTRFVLHSDNRRDLDEVLGWKSAQYLATGKRDLFLTPWVRKTVERIHTMRSKSFSGILSLLYVEDRVIAGHFGMRAGTVWHYWFPAYDPTFARYSPGLILLLRMAEAAPSLGVRTIDFGKGLAIYKERFRNGYVTVAQGSVMRPSLLKVGRQINRQGRSLARNLLRRVPGIRGWRERRTPRRPYRQNS
jgi:CelD/BcsL family acetyltransferase involved in cellulose biosynthesis